MKRLKIFFNLLFLSFLFLGCSQKKLYIYKTTKTNSLETIKNSKQYYLRDKINEEEAGIFQAYTNPNYLGASPLLTKHQYFLKKINRENLLFKNFGIKNYLYQLIYVTNFNTAEEKAKKLGYKNIEQLYISILNNFVNKSPKNFTDFLYTLNSKDKININDIMNKKNIETKIDNIIYTIYGKYLLYEKEDYPTLYKEWAIFIGEEPLYIKRTSLKPYAVILLTIDSLLNH